MYDLHKLGWKSFQQLCLTVVSEILGQTVESFLDTNDGGQDGAFTGIWSIEGQEDLSGSFVVQCKHTSRAAYSLRISDISDEIEKAKRLVAQGRCESYILMTNAGVSGNRRLEIIKSLENAGVKHIRVFGSSWINQKILENQRLRMLVPRIYGLGDLSQILDGRAYDQARNILESMRDDLAKVVVTESYRRAAEAVYKQGFVLLIGEPASGKTTIASLLAVAAVDQWRASVLKLDAPQDVAKRWNPKEPSQFFWIDDAFGVTQYEDHLAIGWNHILTTIAPMLSRGAKIVMTSRDYIYNSARRDLKISSFPLLNESQVVINVRELTQEEKSQILYNHLKLGRQPQSFRTQIKPFLEGVAKHPAFIPDTARRLATPLFTENLLITKNGIEQFVENREQLLVEVIQGLDVDSQAALALIFMRKGRLLSPIELDPSEEHALARLGSDLGPCISALNSLNGSLVTLSLESGNPVWQFIHPTVGDAYAELLAENPEHIGIFLQGSAPERLVNQVTCGDVGIEKSVVLPSSLNSELLEKLDELSQSIRQAPDMASRFEVRRALIGFLARRCSREFLELYIRQNSAIHEEISEPGLYLSVVPEVRLATRLYQFGLLPEKQRRKFVRTVSRYALDGQDVSVLDDEELRSVFTDYEFKELTEKLRENLLPRLSDVRIDWESDYSGWDWPEAHIEMLLELLHTLGKYFSDDEKSTAKIADELTAVHQWIDEQRQNEYDTEFESDFDQWQTEDNTLEENPQSSRSRFEDVDED